MEWIIIIILVLVVAYFFGLTIVNVIDNRLANIRINIPTSPTTTQNVEAFSNSTDTPVVQDTPAPDGYAPKKYSQLDRQMFGMDLWNGGIDAACVQDHDHKGCALYGPCNFPDPRKMSDVDREFHKRNYRPTDMTLQDYINYLWLFRTELDKLPYEHSKNLGKLKRGEQLKFQIGVLPPPQTCMPSINSEDYFNCLIGKNTDLNASQSKFIQAANIDNY